ncbi:MAG: hypothetical protein JW716_04930 [Candidatus Aenigmarchaeota archaeon]|nr:hypothetical protein [Candidatus Aenigmarchaeota archaeon]
MNRNPRIYRDYTIGTLKRYGLRRRDNFTGYAVFEKADTIFFFDEMQNGKYRLKTSGSGKGK